MLLKADSEGCKRMYRLGGGRGMRLSISQRMPHGRLQAANRVQSPPVTGGEKSTVAERAKNIIQARKGEGIRYEEI